VDVVVPCYNYGHYLQRCVDSVLGQEGVDVRVLIIDDASPDGSAAAAAALAAGDPRVTARAHEVNAGHIATYNEGLLGWATADYVALLSADDFLTPGSLQRSVSVMERNPNVGMVYGRAIEFDQTPPAVTAPKRTGVTVWEGRAWLERRFAEGVNAVPCPGVLVRTSVQREAGGYDPELPHAGDFEMWLRIAAIADLGYVRGAPQAGYRVHRASMSQNVYLDPLADPRERALVFERFVGKCGDRLTGSDRLWARARRALAVDVLRLACRASERGDEDDAAHLESFARDLVPDVERLGGFRALQRRRRIRPVPLRRVAFIGARAARRVRSELWWFRWRRIGG
jgi:glycosyltransferase involved in cell wall biosynthesis